MTASALPAVGETFSLDRYGVFTVTGFASPLGVERVEAVNAEGRRCSFRRDYLLSLLADVPFLSGRAVRAKKGRA